MDYKGLVGIASFSIGGSIFVYILCKIITNAGYQQSATFDEIQNLILAGAFGGFVAFLLIGLGLWLIIHDRPKTKN
jgi:hypothetical protein